PRSFWLRASNPRSPLKATERRRSRTQIPTLSTRIRADLYIACLRPPSYDSLGSSVANRVEQPCRRGYASRSARQLPCTELSCPPSVSPVRHVAIPLRSSPAIASSSGSVHCS